MKQISKTKLAKIILIINTNLIIDKINSASCKYFETDKKS